MVDEADVIQEVNLERFAPGLDLICRGIRGTSPDDDKECCSLLVPPTPIPSPWLCWRLSDLPRARKVAPFLTPRSGAAVSLDWPLASFDDGRTAQYGERRAERNL
jgi:hypothetical protein